MLVHLVHMGTSTSGVGPTYTAHLAFGLRALGCAAPIWQIGPRHDGRDCHFRAGLPYQTTTVAALEDVARRGARMHITAIDKNTPRVVARLTAAGATVTIHGASDLSEDVRGALRDAQQIILPRREMLTHFNKALPARHVPYPYQRAPLRPPGNDRQLWAVALGRPGAIEGAQHLVDANVTLSPERRIQMYRGSWPVDDLWATVKLARQASWVVDMSLVLGDRDGTPYDLLATLDGGAALLLHRDRTFISRQDEGLENVASYTDPARLAERLTGEPPTPSPEAIRGLFARHAPRACARRTFAPPAVGRGDGGLAVDSEQCRQLCHVGTEVE